MTRGKDAHTAEHKFFTLVGNDDAEHFTEDVAGVVVFDVAPTGFVRRRGCFMSLVVCTNNSGKLCLKPCARGIMDDRVWTPVAWCLPAGCRSSGNADEQLPP